MESLQSIGRLADAHQHVEKTVSAFSCFLLLLSAWFAWLGSNEVGDLRRAFDVELMHRVLQDTVGIGHALVLTQMLKPRFNEECFQILPFFGRIFKDTPCISAVTTPLMG
jgi:hypothetical protein